MPEPTPLPPEPSRTPATRRCWVCGSDRLARFRDAGVAPETLGAASFRISDAAYGRTLALERCLACGFVQLADDVDVAPFYARMDDPGYEEIRPFRLLQARELLASLPPGARGGRLLDVGAGTGALVEEAGRAGWAAEGLELSASLAARGRERGLAIHEGSLPHPGLNAPYDVVTLVDVIEHVTEPRRLVEEVRRIVRPGGRVLVVTPDVKSLAAKILGHRWWHYRVAHVGYFSPRTLEVLLSGSGFVLESRRRPAWYFPLGYLWTRAAMVLPFLPASPLPGALTRATIRLNLLDSFAATYRAPSR